MKEIQSNVDGRMIYCSMKLQNHRESKRGKEQKEHEFGKSTGYRDRTRKKGKEMQ